MGSAAPISNLAMHIEERKDECMRVTRVERFLVSAIYVLLALSAVRLFMAGFANAKSSDFQDIKLLLASALLGAVILFSSAILIHFRPAKAYVAAMVALQLLVLAFFPLIAPFVLQLLIHRTLSGSISTYALTDIFAIALLAVTAIFTPVRLFRLVS
jgi:hypothetical protein